MSSILPDTVRNGIDFANSLIALPSQFWPTDKFWSSAKIVVVEIVVDAVPSVIVASRAHMVTETKEIILI